MQILGFFAELFDFSFREFLSTKLVKVLYPLCLLVIGIFYLNQIVRDFQIDAGQGFLTLFVGALVAILFAILARIFFEVVLTLFRIEQNTRK